MNDIQQYQVYHLHRPTDLIFDTYEEAYRAGIRRYNEGIEFDVVTIWRKRTCQ